MNARVYLCFSLLGSPEAWLCLPAASLLAPHRNPNSAAMGQAVCLTLSYGIETLRLGGREVRMGSDSFWRVHLLNLRPSWTMFRLGRRSKRWTPGLGWSACGWDPCCWNTEADRSQALHSFCTSVLTRRFIWGWGMEGGAWVNVEEDGGTLALRTLEIVVAALVFSVVWHLRPSNLSHQQRICGFSILSGN